MSDPSRDVHSPSVAVTSSDDSPLAQALARYAELQEQGHAPTPQDFAAQHPEMREELLACLQQMDWIGQVADDLSHGLLAGELTDADGPPKERILGDYRILRQIGRGGMGVVYEAEQISLRRRVALKILAGAGMLDPRALSRFKNEVHAAASLDHPHIVDIIGVGCERGIHYYAMRLIDGRTLAEVIDLLQQQCAADPSYQPSSLLDVASLEPSSASSQNDQAAAAAETRAKAGSKTPRFRADYFRSIAEIGAQAAEALDYAHDEGVIHRDIKPSNLMLDSRGKLWVTDFGLARIESAESMTITGDLVGTLRYMSPEQAFAKRAAVDHRTDVYSLGATLYELLTLRPLIEAADREEVLNWLRDKEPTPLRRIVPQIPVDLETIVLKAVAREPADRYETPQELAKDLRKFLAGNVITARRPGIWKRVRHTIKRRYGVITAAAVTVVLAASIAISYGIERYSQFNSTIALVREALSESARFEANHRWNEALEAAKRAKALAEAGITSEEWHRAAKLRLEDVEAAMALDDVRIRIALRWNRPHFREKADEEYALLFSELGARNLDEMPFEELVDLLRQRTTVSHLAVSLDSWAANLQEIGNSEIRRNRRLDLARALDPDPTRNRIRDAITKSDAEKNRILVSIANDPQSLELSPVSIALLAEWLLSVDEVEVCLELLHAAQPRHPSDFWINQHLGAISIMQQLNPMEAASFLRVAVSQRPECGVNHEFLGHALVEAGYLADGLREIEIGISISPTGEAYQMLGHALARTNRVDEALVAFEKAIALKSTHSRLYWEVAIAHLLKNDPRTALLIINDRLNAEELDLLYYNAACYVMWPALHLKLPKEEAALQRSNAEKWLRLCLPGVRRNIERKRILPPKRRLSWWEEDPDLVLIRDAKHLAHLTPEEREHWEAFWAEVRNLRVEQDAVVTKLPTTE